MAEPTKKLIFLTYKTPEMDDLWLVSLAPNCPQESKLLLDPKTLCRGHPMSSSLTSTCQMPAATHSPRCENQKRLQTLPSIPSGSRSPAVEDCSGSLLSHLQRAAFIFRGFEREKQVVLLVTK